MQRPRTTENETEDHEGIRRRASDLRATRSRYDGWRWEGSESPGEASTSRAIPGGTDADRNPPPLRVVDPPNLPSAAAFGAAERDPPSTREDFLTTWEDLSPDLGALFETLDKFSGSELPEAETVCRPGSEAFLEVAKLRKALFEEGRSLDEEKTREVLLAVQRLNLGLFTRGQGMTDGAGLLRRSPLVMRSIREGLGPSTLESGEDFGGGERAKWEEQLEARIAAEVGERGLPSLNDSATSLSEWMVRMGYRGDAEVLTSTLANSSRQDRYGIIHRFLFSELG